MKSKSDTLRYIRKSAGLNATVCKDVPPPYQQRGKKERLPHGKIQHSVSIPPEWEVALQDMYPGLSVPIAIRKFIIEHLQPAEIKE